MLLHGPLFEPFEEASAREVLDRNHDDDKHIEAEQEGNESDDNVA